MARGAALPGVPPSRREVEVFLLDAASGRYLGRLCTYGQCPKGKPPCLVPGCGSSPFLQQIAGFRLYKDALAEDRIMRLFDRRAGGIIRRAADTPPSGREDEPGADEHR